MGNEKLLGKQRYSWIDWTKTIGMLMIVWGHSNLSFFSDFVYSFSVGLFFIIAGFLSRCKSDDVQFQLKKIVNTLIIPYLCYSILNLLVIYSLQFAKGTLTLDVIAKGLIAHAIGLQGSTVNGCGCGPLWFIYTLVLIKILCVFLDKKFIYLISLIGFLLSIYFHGIGCVIDWAVTNSFLALPCFSIGLLMSNYKESFMRLAMNIQKMKALPSFTIALILFAVTFYISRFTGPVRMFRCDYGQNAWLFMLSSISGTGFVAFVSMRISNISAQYATIISKGNILILALHFHLIRISAKFVTAIGLSPLLQDLSSLILSVIIMIAFIPIIKYARQHVPVLIGNR